MAIPLIPYKGYLLFLEPYKEISYVIEGAQPHERFLYVADSNGLRIYAYKNQSFVQ